MTRGLQLTYTQPAVKEGDNPTETMDLETSTSNRVFDVAWANRFTAYQQLLGYSSIDTSGGTGNWKLHRYLPDQLPSAPNMVATRITRTEGMGSRGYATISGRRENIYEICRIWVTYEMPDYVVAEDNEILDYGSGGGPGIQREMNRYCEFSTRPSAEYIAPPSGFLKYSEGSHKSIPLGSSVGIILGTLDYVIRWHQVPYEGLPANTIQDTIGRVNKTTWIDNFFPTGKGATGCDPGTLLMIGGEYRLRKTPRLERAWEIEYTFKYNPHGHNNFWDPTADPTHPEATTDAFYQASSDGVKYTPGSVPDGKLLFDEREFDDLFDINKP